MPEENELTITQDAYFLGDPTGDVYLPAQGPHRPECPCPPCARIRLKLKREAVVEEKKT
jgi:hypothetical protein